MIRLKKKNDDDFSRISPGGGIYSKYHMVQSLNSTCKCIIMVIGIRELVLLLLYLGHNDV